MIEHLEELSSEKALPSARAHAPAAKWVVHRLRREPTLTPRVNREWASVDRLVARAAVWAPFVNREYIDFFGANMDLTGSCYTNHIVYQLDFALVCRK